MCNNFLSLKKEIMIFLDDKVINQIPSAHILENWAKKHKRSWKCNFCHTFNSKQLPNQVTVTNYCDVNDRTFVKINFIYNCYICDTPKVHMGIFGDYNYFPAGII